LSVDEVPGSAERRDFDFCPFFRLTVESHGQPEKRLKN